MYKLDKLKLPKIGTKSEQYDFVIGCRKEGTTEGDWNGALVLVKNKDENMCKVILFEDGLDFSGNSSIKKSLSIYNDYINQDWKKMNKNDMELTASISINEGAIIDYKLIVNK